MELLNNILFWITFVFIALTLMTFFFQILFMFFFYLKPRQYKKAKKYHDFTIIIRAHNEEDVIADSVDSAMKCDYPEDKKHVIVFCHNCTDKTAEIAKAHGARTVVVTDMDPKHKKAAYCMKLGMDQLKKDPEGTYEYFCFIDADNQVDINYLKECNNAVDSGVVLGRTFENSKNLTDNLISCMTGLWYIRDNRFACRPRSAFHMGSVMNGCCSVVKAEYALNWDAMSSSDDIEFTLKRLVKDDLIVDYIDKAIIYEDQPTSLKDMFNRNSRMGNGLIRLYFKDGLQVLKKFFTTLFNPKVPFSLKMTYLDQYLNIALVPFSIVCFTWIPIYFIYVLIYTGLGNSIYISGLNYAFDFNFFVWFVIIAALSCYLVPFFFQPLVSLITERKKLIIKNKTIAFWSIVLYPTYILLDAVSIFYGFFMKPKWKKITRSKTKINQ